MSALITLLREQDEDFLSSRGLTYVVTVADSFVNVIIADFPCPGLTPGLVDLLLRLPFGFPDVAPDMFWVAPALTASGTTIAGTELTETHLERSWQRWSRHIGGQWRPGIDNLETYLGYVRRAMALAAGN